MIKHANITIRGRVQGVFFRDSVEKRAIDYALTGFVQNEPDGSVYIEIEGEEEKIDKFIDWCKEGPVGAIVEDVEYEFGPVKKFAHFEARY